MKEFAFKPADLEGEDTLKTIALANHFNEWMYKTIKPFCKGKILEIGSGLGNISEFFLHDEASIFLSDIRQGYCDTLKMRFEDSKSLAGIELIDLVDPEFETRFHKLLNSFDTVFALNVVEHIYDDELAVANCRKLLKPGGSLIILVPAYQWLFNSFDRELEHYRRYTRTGLNEVLRSSGLEIAHSQYFNAAGMAGWFISGKLQRNSILPKDQIKLFNKLVLFFKLFDKLIFNSFGLSAISVGKK